jgi:hypothetical protein
MVRMLRARLQALLSLIILAAMGLVEAAGQRWW